MPVQIGELTATAGAGSSEMFLAVQTKRAGKVTGESVAAGHEEEIQLSGWTWGVAASSAVGSTQATGRRSYKALTVFKSIDAATTPLMSALATNDEVKEAKLTMRRAGTDQADHFSVTLSGARVVSIDHVASADGSTVETVGFSFTRVHVEYYPQLTSGARGGSRSFDDEYLLGSGA